MSAVTSEWVDAPPPPGSGDTVWSDRIEELVDAFLDREEDEEFGPWKRYGPYAAASIARSAKNAIERVGYSLDDFDVTTRTIDVLDDDGNPVTDDDGDPKQEVWLYARCVQKPEVHVE